MLFPSKVGNAFFGLLVGFGARRVPDLTVDCAADGAA
jgi:hypothetical protein